MTKDAIPRYDSYVTTTFGSIHREARDFLHCNNVNKSYTDPKSSSLVYMASQKSETTRTKGIPL